VEAHEEEAKKRKQRREETYGIDAVAVELILSKAIKQSNNKETWGSEITNSTSHERG
jgi:hypothetical protein